MLTFFINTVITIGIYLYLISDVFKIFVLLDTSKTILSDKLLECSDKLNSAWKKTILALLVSVAAVYILDLLNISLIAGLNGLGVVFLRQAVIVYCIDRIKAFKPKV